MKQTTIEDKAVKRAFLLLCTGEMRSVEVTKRISDLFPTCDLRSVMRRARLRKYETEQNVQDAEKWILENLLSYRKESRIFIKNVTAALTGFSGLELAEEILLSAMETSKMDLADDEDHNEQQFIDALIESDKIIFQGTETEGYILPAYYKRAPKFLDLADGTVLKRNGKQTFRKNGTTYLQITYRQIDKS